MTTTNAQVLPLDHREAWLPLLEESVCEVFEIMVGSRLEPVATAHVFPGLEFTSMVGLSGRICGILTLCTSARSAALIASKMLGVEAEEADPRTWDVLGEVCTMIAGTFKNKLPGGGESCMLSVPTVITGVDYNLHFLSEGDSLRVMLAFEGALIVVAVELHA